MPRGAGGYQHVGNRLRRRLDRLARQLITLAGIGIIVSISAIFVFIALEVYPLFVPARAEPTSEFALGVEDPVLVVASDDYGEQGVVLRASGLLQVFPLAGGTALLERRLVESGEVTAAVRRPSSGDLALGLADGRVLFWKAAFESRFEDSKRVIDLALEPHGEARLLDGMPVEVLAYAATEDGRLVAAGRAGEIVLYSRSETRSLLGGTTIEDEQRFDLAPDVSQAVTALALTSDGRRLYAATTDGMLHRWNVTPDGPEHQESVRATEGSEIAVTALDFLIGDRTLVVGDASGAVSAWFLVRSRDAPSGWRTMRIHELAGHGRPVVAISPSLRRKSFLTGDAVGRVWMHHATSEQTLLRMPATGGAVRALFFGAKEDAAISVDEGGRLSRWSMDAPHPEVTWKTLFGKVWYEEIGRAHV